MSATLFDLATYRQAKAFYAEHKPPFPGALVKRKARDDARVQDTCGAAGLPFVSPCKLEPGHEGPHQGATLPGTYQWHSAPVEGDGV